MDATLATIRATAFVGRIGTASLIVRHFAKKSHHKSPAIRIKETALKTGISALIVRGMVTVQRIVPTVEIVPQVQTLLTMVHVSLLDLISLIMNHLMIQRAKYFANRKMINTDILAAAVTVHVFAVQIGLIFQTALLSVKIRTT